MVLCAEMWLKCESVHLLVSGGLRWWFRLRLTDIDFALKVLDVDGG